MKIILIAALFLNLLKNNNNLKPLKPFIPQDLEQCEKERV